MKEQKVGLTPLNWALSIGGIIFLLTFILLPPIFRVVFKEEEKTPIEEVTPEKKMMCTKETETEGVKITDQYYLSGKKDNLELISYTKMETYETIPETLKAECDNSKEIYGQDIPGLYFSCQVLYNQYTLETRVDKTTYQGETLPFIIDINQNYDAFQNSLIDTGFTCEETK